MKASTLDGITVLDLSTGPAGSLATMFLSDQGARVIRLVDLGDTAPRRGGYLVWDRGKTCLRLDFSQLGPQRSDAPDSPGAAFIKLIRSADVLVDDFAPASERQRLVDADWLRGLNPRLIHCSITAYGKQGPWKDEPPIDALVMARMGILGSQPGFRPAPVHVVHPLPSSGAALLANLGIAACLLARERTGRGRKVETSLMGGALLYHPKVVGEHIESRGHQTNPSGSAPFYSNYACADGEYVQLGCVHEKFINIAADLFGLTDALKDPRFGNGRMPQTPEADAECRALVAQAVRRKPYAEWAQLFEASDVPFARCQVCEDGMADPQVQFNDMVVELQDPELGPVTQMGVPIHFSETPGRIQGPRVPPAQAATTLPDDLPNDASTPTTGPDGPFEPPLQGIRILEITNLIAGPTGGRLLADLGADVIKFEPLAGDISRPIGRTYFFNVNANKRSVSVDTRTPEGKEVAQHIAASADAILANLRPHATERMGISPAINPQLIETHLTGYGWTGPYAKRPGIDPLAQGLMGLQRAQGGAKNPPVFPAQLAPTDYTTGAMGALGTILAIYTRLRTGVTQRVDSNLLNGGAVLSSEWFTRYAGKPERPLADQAQYGLNPFHRLYEVRDGWIYVVAESEAERRAMRQAVDAEDLLGADGDALNNVSGAAHPNDTPLAQSLAARFAAVQMDDILQRLQTAGVPCAPALSGDSEIFLDHPHASANGMIATYEHAWAGKLRVAWRYVQFGDTAPVQGKSTPLLGEQNREVLREVGYSDEAIDELYAKGVIKTETVS